MTGRCPECHRPNAIRVDECATHRKQQAMWDGLRNAGRSAERVLDESGFTTRQIIEEQGLSDELPRGRKHRRPTVDRWDDWYKDED